MEETCVIKKISVMTVHKISEHNRARRMDFKWEILLFALFTWCLLASHYFLPPHESMMPVMRMLQLARGCMPL
jgi:hypothetical protein